MGCAAAASSASLHQAAMDDLTVITVAYRPGDDLAPCLDSALALAGLHASIVVINNDPDDALPRQLGEQRGISVVESGGNVGFCAAVNLGLRRTRSRYVLLLNQDATVAPDYAVRLVEAMERDARVASAGGRILRGRQGASDHVDSVGLTMLPGRRPADLLHGERVAGPASGVSEVFGVTAAAAIYRRAALDEVAVEGSVLPDEFFMYLDDVDLAWRLRLRGYTSLVDQAAVAWHERGTAGDDNERPGGLRGVIATMRREAARPDYVRERSWVNQLLMIVRNDDPGLFLAQLPRMAVLRSRVDAFGLAQRPVMALRARQRAADLLPGAIRQRRRIREFTRVPARDMARWLP